MMGEVSQPANNCRLVMVPSGSNRQPSLYGGCAGFSLELCRFHAFVCGMPAI